MKTMHPILRAASFAIVSFLLLVVFQEVYAVDELYIISVRDGSTIVVKDYKFTDENVEFSTENGLPGFIKKEEFVSIANMLGVPPGEAERIREKVNREKRIKKIVLLACAIVAVLFAVLLVYLSGKRKKGRQGASDVFYGRKEKEPTTQGHLSFEYKGALGRITKWTIDVRSAYEEEGILYVEGICTTSEKRKTFRADKVVGPVTDMSSEHHAPMDHFFVDTAGGG